MTLLAAKNMAISIAQKTICQNLGLRIKMGECWAVMGPNGSGKTTLLHSLAGLRPLTQGKVLLEDVPITALSPKHIAKKVAVLFQEQLTDFPQTVWEHCLVSRFPHLAYFQRETAKDKDIVAAALAAMGLDDMHYRPIAHLSGGEKRRLAIACVLAQTASLYLLDEPTNHLDLRHQVHALRHFHQLATQKKATIMMATHDANVAQQFCDHVLLLFDDGTTQQGPPETVLTAEALSRLFHCPIKAVPALDRPFWSVY